MSRGTSSCWHWYVNQARWPACCLWIAPHFNCNWRAGFGNAYMVNTKTEAAITWNDISVNENMHAATAFRLLLQV